MAGLAGFWSYGLESVKFEVLVKMKGQLEFWCELGVKVNLSTLKISNVRCMKWFHGQIEAGLGFGML